ncbi:MAG: methionyl-tRNA formyltransferase, partial [Lachnospiraceae bacterium]|nr:methionyl-tRNA formyltransferase [Lachnospiraceae bacterium]
MKIVFMGTPDFAVETLNEIVNAGHEVALVVTQPDKPKGRGNKMQFPPVKERALELGLSVEQPVKVKDDEFIKKLEEIKPDA